MTLRVGPGRESVGGTQYQGRGEVYIQTGSRVRSRCIAVNTSFKDKAWSSRLYLWHIAILIGNKLYTSFRSLMCRSPRLDERVLCTKILILEKGEKNFSDYLMYMRNSMLSIHISIRSTDPFHPLHLALIFYLSNCDLNL